MIRPKRSKQAANWGKEKSERMHDKLAAKIDRDNHKPNIRAWRKPND
jgi:hypothetical protein